MNAKKVVSILKETVSFIEDSSQFGIIKRKEMII